MADVLGRPKSIAIGAAVFGFGAALEAGAVGIGIFGVGRIVAGIGEGLYRDTLVVQVQLLTSTSRRKRGGLTGSFIRLHLRDLAAEPARAANRGSAIDVQPSVS